MRVLAILGLGLVALVGGAPLLGAGPSSDSELQKAAERLVASSEIPAVITLVEKDGKRIVVAAGEADLRSHRAARPDDRFWVGSVTKSFVATVVMQLVAERKLRLDDTIHQLLPGRLREGGRSGSGTCSTTRAGFPTTCGSSRGAARSRATRAP